jgi:hypothetical protein
VYLVVENKRIILIFAAKLVLVPQTMVWQLRRLQFYAKKKNKFKYQKVFSSV